MSGKENMLKFAVTRRPDGAKRELYRDGTLLNTKIVDVDSFIGKEIAIPVCLWHDLAGYEQIKKKQKRLHFRIVSRYYRRPCFQIKGICKDGRLHKQAERFLHYSRTGGTLDL